MLHCNVRCVKLEELFAYAKGDIRIAEDNPANSTEAVDSDLKSWSISARYIGGATEAYLDDHDVLIEGSVQVSKCNYWCRKQAKSGALTWEDD
jgi:hypothetical protein